MCGVITHRHSLGVGGITNCGLPAKTYLHIRLNAKLLPYDTKLRYQTVRAFSIALQKMSKYDYTSF